MVSSIRVLTGVVLALTSAGPMVGGVVAEPAELRLGRQRQNIEIVREVALTNTGSSPVVLTGVESDCACGTGELAVRLLEPNASTSLTVRFATRMYQGEIRRRIIVHTSEGDVRVPIVVEVTPYENWSVSPWPVVLMPSLQSQTSTATFTLSYTGPAGARATAVASSHGWLRAELAAGAAGGTSVVTLRKGTDAPVGNLAATVTISTTDPAVPELAVAVVVPVASNARLAPNPIVLPATRPGVESRAAFRIMGWTGQQPPDVRVPHGTVIPLGELNGEYTFEIGLTPGQAGTVVQMLQVYDGASLQFEAQVVVRVGEVP